MAACIGGASSASALESMLTDAGFVDVTIEPDDDSESFIEEWDDERDPSDSLLAATIEAEKPAAEV